MSLSETLKSEFLRPVVPTFSLIRFGWRRCTDFEKEALLTHYKDMGERMGIKYVSWESWDDANNLQAAYAVRGEKAQHCRCCCTCLKDALS